MRGFTRAAAFGPIADMIELKGGSVSRVFQSVDLPEALLESPSTPLPLVEQHRVLNAAAQETGDPLFGADLGQRVSVNNLGAFSAWIGGTDTLASLLDRSAMGIATQLQTATELFLRIHGKTVRYSIVFTEERDEPWFQTELLALGYLVDIVRLVMGHTWKPDLIRSTCVGRSTANKIEKIFDTPVQYGSAVSEIEFSVGLLTCTRAKVSHLKGAVEPSLPNGEAIQSDVSALLALALLEGQPRIDWVAKKLGLSRRSVQRALESEGTSYSELLGELLRDRAMAMLSRPGTSITDVALALGYSDVAHFSRAFRQWTGVPPSHFAL